MYNVSVDVTGDKTHLQEILERDEFMTYHRQSDHVRDWIVDGLKYIYHQVVKLIPDRLVPKNLPANHWISYLLIIAALGLLAYMIYWFTSQLIGQRRLSKRLYLTEEELTRSFTYYMQCARQCETEGHWKEGARDLFLALLFYCDGNGWIRVEGWKTNGEYAEALRGQKPELLGDFKKAALLFDQVRYGKKEIHADDFQMMYRLVEPIVQGGELSV